MSPTATPPVLDASLVPRLSRINVAQYDRLIAAGAIFDAEDVELIEGLLVNKMGRNRPHVLAGKQGLAALQRIVPAGWHVAKKDPIQASDWSKPEPDLAVIRGEITDYVNRDVAAADVGLVVEIAESSLTIDRDVMGRLYAVGGIACYWIVNLVDVYSDPDPAAGYRSREDYRLGETFAVTLDGVEVGRAAVSELLPPKPAA